MSIINNINSSHNSLHLYLNKLNNLHIIYLNIYIYIYSNIENRVINNN